MQTPEEVAKRFLRYSFVEIGYVYDNLTEREKQLCTREEFELLKRWMSVPANPSQAL